MLSILGSKQRFCDGVSRRNFLKIGGLALGGMCLPQLLRAESTSGSQRSHKAIIMIFLPGGPPHQDMFDLKFDAPAEIRGEFRPDQDQRPRHRDLRALPAAGHDDGQGGRRPADGRAPRATTTPSSASPVAATRTSRPAAGPRWAPCSPRCRDPAIRPVPPFVGLSPKMGHMPWADAGTPGFLGLAHAPFKPGAGAGREDMVLQGITLDRLGDRRALLGSFDRLRREIDSTGMMAGLDKFNEQAFGVITSSRLMEALDIDKRGSSRPRKLWPG